MDDSYQLTAFLAVNNLSDLSWSMQIYSIHSLIELFSIPQRHLSHMFGTVRSAQLKVALEKFEKTRSTAKGARQRSLSSSFHAQRSDKLVSTTVARTSSPSIHIEVESRDLGVPDTGKMIRFWSARGSLAKQKTDAKSSPTTPLDVREAKKGNTITRFDHSGGFANTSEIRVRPLTPQPESKRIVEPFRRVSSMRSVRDGQKKVGAYIKKIPSPESKREVPLRTSIDPIEARSTSPLASNQPPTRINNVATRMMRSKSNDMACRSPHVRPASRAIPASQIQSKHQCLRKEDEKKIKSIPHMRPWGASSNRSNSVLPPARRKVPVPSSQGNSKTPADANQHLSPVIRRVAPRSNIERTKKTIGSGFNNTGTALHTSNAPTRQKSGDMEILSGVIRLKFSPEKPSLQRNLQTCRVRENNKGVLPRRGDTTANMWAGRSLSPPFQASPHRSAEERGRRGVQPQPELKSKKDPNVVDGTRLRYGRPRPNMISPTAVGSRSPFGRRPPTTTESAHQPRVTESSRLSASNLRIHTLSCTQYPDLPTLISPGVVRRVIHDPYHAEETGNAIEAPVFHLEPKVWKLYAKVNPEVNKQHLERILAKQSDLESSGRKNSGVDTTEETTDPQFGKLSLDNTVQDMVDCEVPFEARLSRVVSQSRFLHFREEKQEEILALLGYHPELHSVLIQLLREGQRSPSSDPKKLSVQASGVYAI